MNFSHYAARSLCLVLLATLTGCAKYEASPLAQLTPPRTEKQDEKYISFAHHVFDKDDCKEYLDRDVLAKGYQPVHIAITNNTYKYLKFSPAEFNIPCVNVQNIRKKVSTNTTGRVLGYGLGGTALYGATAIVGVGVVIAASITGSIAATAVFILGGAILVAGTVGTYSCFIAAITDGCWSAQANTALRADYTSKTLHDQVIAPMSRINGLVFVPVKTFKPEFAFTLVDETNNEQFTLSTAQPLITV